MYCVLNTVKGNLFCAGNQFMNITINLNLKQ